MCVCVLCSAEMCVLYRLNVCVCVCVCVPLTQQILCSILVVVCVVGEMVDLGTHTSLQACKITTRKRRRECVSSVVEKSRGHTARETEMQKW